MEKKRRARINESLQELRLILADTEVTSCPAKLGLSQEGRGGPVTNSLMPSLSALSLLLAAAALLVPDEDGECRGAGDDGETGPGHSAEQVAG